MTKIRAYNSNGLLLLWREVRKTVKSDEEALNQIYRTYGPQQWQRKCNELGFRIPGNRTQKTTFDETEW
jgi:hypothetical protein